MNDMTQEFEEQPQVPRSGPGRQLKAAREARKMTIEEAAAGLHLHERLVHALEADDNEHLPPPAFVVGYLRNYARLLELPQEEILASYSGRIVVEPPRLVSRMRADREVRSSDLLVRLVTWLIVLGLMGLVGWSLMQYGGHIPGITRGGADVAPAASTPSTSPSPSSSPAPLPGRPLFSLPGEQPTPIMPPPSIERPAPVAPSAATPPPATEPSPFAGLGRPEGSAPVAPAAGGSGGLTGKPHTGGTGAPTAAAGTAPAVTGAPTATAGGSTPPAAVTPPPPAAPAAATQTPAAPAASETASAPTAPNEIRLEFTADSWARVTDANGKRLLGDLVRSGTSKDLKGQPPFEVTLGYAPGVTLLYEGKPFDHSAFNRKNIAKFTIGKAPPKPAEGAAEEPTE